jgi:hypothetical protein
MLRSVSEVALQEAGRGAGNYAPGMMWQVEASGTKTFKNS